MTQPKGRPTPKRGAAPRGPVAPPPQTRREAAARLREQQAEGRKGRRAGYVANDSAALLPRDAGPVRRLVRDVVDSRRNIGVLLTPLALLVVVAQFGARNDTVTSVAGRVFSIGLIAVLVDFILIIVRVRKTVGARFPDERLPRHIGYALVRSTVLRRFRMPPPLVQPGDTPQVP